ncbi:MAG: YegP family protein [Labilithrix sp.]
MIRHILALVAVIALSLSTVACAAQNDGAADATEASDQDLVAQSAKFDVFVGADGDYYFRFVAANGEILLRSEGYTTRQGADNGIDSVVANAPDTRNVDVLQAADGQWYFTVKAANEEIIATSEMYVSKFNAERGARTVRALARELRNAD